MHAVRSAVSFACTVLLVPWNTLAADLRGVATVAGSRDSTCAITVSGALKCWGANFSGQLAYGPTTSQPSAVNALGLHSRVIAVGGGRAHTCALTSSGSVKCWGLNAAGQLGDGSRELRVKPVDVQGLSGGVTAISMAESYSCALTDAGGVKCWGLHPGLTALQTDQRTPIDVAGVASGVVAISAGDDFMCILNAMGAVQCWGQNVFGQLGDGTRSWRPTPVEVAGLSTGVAAISSGLQHVCALTTLGEVKCWGSNSNGQLGNGSIGSNGLTPTTVNGLDGPVKSIAAGDA